MFHKLNQIPTKLLLALAFLLLASIVFLLRLRQKPETVEAGWWNDSWHYRQPISIGWTGTALTDFQVSVDIGTSTLINAGKMQTDCDDIRITDDKGNLLNHWIEENNPGCNAATNTKIWTKLSSIQSVGTTIYLYYGNSTASNVEDGNSIFVFFDNFVGTTLDTTKWTQINGTTPSLSGGTMTITATANPGKLVAITAPSDNNYSIKSRFQVIGGTNTDERAGLSIKTDSSTGMGYNYVFHDFTNLDEIRFLNDGVAWGTTTATSWSKNTFYTMEIYHNGTYVRARHNDGSWYSQTWSSRTGYPALNFGSFSSDAITIWDYAFVRKVSTSDPSTTPQSEQTGTGPIAYWDFNEGGSTIAHDLIGGQNGTIINADWVPGKYGQALYYQDNTTDRVVMPTDFSELTSELTVSAWVYPASAPNDTGRVVATTYDWDTVGANVRGWTLGNNYGTVDAFNFLVYDSSGNGANATYSDFFANNLNKWTHVVGVFKPSEYVRVYVNGKMVAEDNTNVPASIGYNGTYNMTLGSRADSTLQGEWDGDIDDVKLFDYSLSDAQIKKEYNRGAGVAIGVGPTSVGSTTPIAHWNFNEGAGTTAYDTSGNGYHAVFSSGSSAPSWTSGKIGKALSFDGADDMATASNLTWTPTTFTVSWWLYPKSLANYNQLLGGSNSWGTFVFHTTSTGGVYVGTDLTTRFTPTDIPAGTVETNKWQHFTYIYNGTQGSFYKNGQLLAGPKTQDLPTAWGGFKMGKNSSTTINGYLDHVKIFNTALTPDQVAIEYNRGSALALGVSQSSIDVGSTNLVAEWKFEEGVGTTAYDTSGNNNHSTQWNGTPTWTSGKFGKALLFDGSGNSGIEIVSPTNLNTPSFTASVWIDGTNQSAVTRIIQFGTNGSNYGGYIIGQNTNGTIRTYIDTTGTGSWDSLASVGTVNDNKWHHIALVYDGTNRFIYIDGIRDASTDIPSAYYYSPTDPIITIGQSSYDHEEHTGKIDHVKIWNTALTPSQIAWEYNQGAPIGHWRLDEKSGLTAFDSSGNNNHGTLGTGSSSPTWVSGKLNNSASFDGNDHINIADSDNLSFGNSTADRPFSITAWINQNVTSNKGIFAKGNATTPEYKFHISGNSLRLELEDNTQDAYCYGGAFDLSLYTNQWTFVVATYNGNGSYTGIKLSLNGSDLTDSTGSCSGYTAMHNQAEGAVIGRDGTTGLQKFDGEIDDVRIYNYVLTNDQIKTLYNGGSSVKFN